MTTPIIEQIKSYCTMVANKLGKGYSECIYQEALCSELRKNNILYSKEQVIPILYENIVVGTLRMDIVLPYEKIVIEMKAIDNELKESNFPQIITYLKATGYSCGIYVNYIQNPAKPICQTYTVLKNKDGLYACQGKDKIYWFNEKGEEVIPMKVPLIVSELSAEEKKRLKTTNGETNSDVL